MSIVRLADHSVDLSLLPIEPLVLDVGARGFDFTRAIFHARPLARVVALDPAPDVLNPGYPDCLFLSVALVGGPVRREGFNRVYLASRGTSAFVEEEAIAGAVRVEAVQITRLMRDLSISFWDLVKLDCEGAEFDILGSWPGPLARQISVEFHDALPRLHHRAAELPEILRRLQRWGYDTVQHDAYPLNPGIGHWDSLFVLGPRFPKDVMMGSDGNGN